MRLADGLYEVRIRRDRIVVRVRSGVLVCGRCGGELTVPIEAEK